MKIAELLESILLERSGDWVILPATMALYNKRVVDIITAASTWDSATILICVKREDGGKERFCFVSSASDGFDHYKKDIGRSFETIHDQTGKSKGMYKLVNVAYIKKGEIVKKANEIGLKAKASLSVFK